MIEERLYELTGPVLRPAGAVAEAGEEFRDPALDVRRYYRRAVRWNAVPLLGRGLSVVAVARQPLDVAFSVAGYEELLRRLASAVSSRFPPWQGTVIGLTSLVFTAEPIGPGDEATLERALGVSLRKFRIIPFGLLRINLGQEAIAWALRSSPDQLFPEPVRLADALGEHLRRFVPLFKV
ncbi:MAG: hypothetical protein ACP5XB_18010 [Isosphaeraceae bacterium]